MSSKVFNGISCTILIQSLQCSKCNTNSIKLIASNSETTSNTISIAISITCSFTVKFVVSLG